MTSDTGDPGEGGVLLLSPGWLVVELAAGRFLCAPTAAALIEGEDAGWVVDHVLPLLDGTRNERAVSAALPDLTPETLAWLLADLRSQGVLDVLADPAAAAALTARRRDRLAATSVAVGGAPDLAALCADALVRLGVGRVTTDLATADADLVVALDRSDAALLAWVEQVPPGQPRLAGLVTDGEIVLGPLPRARNGPCFACAALRRRANAPFLFASNPVEDDSLARDRLAAALLATEVCGALDRGLSQSRLVDHVLILEDDPPRTALHRVLPVPGCAVCGGPPAYRPGPLGQARAAPRPDDPMASFAPLVDARTGVIHHVFVEPSARLGLETAVVVTALTASAPDGADPVTPMPAGWGKGPTILDAALGALGEAVERYSASLPDYGRVVWAKLADLPAGEAVDPRAFPLFSAEQYARPDFPFAPFDPDAPHPWIAGAWLGRAGRAWIPATFCYLTFVLHPRQNFCSGSSNGLAAFPDSEEASLRAVLELIERDAFMTSWLTREPVRGVAIDDAWSDDLKAIVAGIAALGGAVEVVLLPSACGYATTAACLALGDGVAWPGVTLGLGTDPDPRAAVRQAVYELGQTGPYLRRLMLDGASVPDGPASVREMLDHAKYYFPAARSKAFDHLRRPFEIVSLGDLPAGPERSLRACGEALARADIRVALVDVTAPDIALTPLRVMRAVSPDLQPITFGHGLERVPVARLAGRVVQLSEEDVSPIW